MRQDPTAKFHEVIADVVQQIISPVQIGQITALNGSNRLDVANVPVGLNGFVDGSTNLAPANWTLVQNITSTNTTQSIFVAQVAATNSGAVVYGDANQIKPADSGGPGLLGGPPPDYIALQFYRLRFPLRMVVAVTRGKTQAAETAAGFAFVKALQPQRSIRSVVSQPMHESVMETP